MKKLILTLVFFPSLIFAQYYNGRSTEQNFETSDFYFNRYVFNPFGMINFREITMGLIDNPFLNIFLNPANITELKDRVNFYVDYRGERTSYNPVFYDFPLPLYNLSFSEKRIDWIPPIYIYRARIEPEPKFSIGLITAPFKSFSDRFFIGATFQRIHKAEKFYSMPYWIYYPLRGYDPFGNRVAENVSFPLIDRYYGKDEMITTANLFSFFTGFKISEKLSAGFQISGVYHSREGGFSDRYNDDYGNIDNTISITDYLIDRNRNYKQIDYTLGLTYFEDVSKIGIKLGLLTGKVDQAFNNRNSSLYHINKPDLSPTWTMYYQDYSSNQAWNNSGNLYFSGFDLSYKINEDIHLIGYFNYITGKINFQNSSSTKDTSTHYSKFDYQYGGQNYWVKDKYNYSLIDYRKGSGAKQKSDYSGLIGIRWTISPKLKVTFGIAYFENNLEINSKEPVVYEAISEYYFNTNNPNIAQRWSYLRVYEDKNLDWHYNSVDFTYQMPVILDFKLSEIIELTLLVNQISGGTKVNEYTNAFIFKRIRTENDSTKQINNFIERYLPPTQNTTFEKTDLIGGIQFHLDPRLKFTFLIDPNLIPSFNIAQVYFNIEGRF